RTIVDNQSAFLSLSALFYRYRTDDAECDVSDRAKSDLVSKLTTEIYAPLPVATQAQLSGLSRRRV
ncbi:hypothetical protein A253_05973, partial [Pseudomonas syringae pv. actinidiae ICMP 19102]